MDEDYRYNTTFDVNADVLNSERVLLCCEGLDTIAAAISESVDAVEDVYEPFLMQQGFLNRTPRGRVVTDAAYRHLGLPAPSEG